MKRSVLVVIGVGTAIGLGLCMTHLSQRPASPEETPTDSAPDATPVNSRHVTVTATQPAEAKRNQAAASGARPKITPDAVEFGQVAPSHPSLVAIPAVNPGFNQLIGTLVSRDATFRQKQAIWKQLKDTGKIDQAIAELEQRVGSDQQSAESAAALGQAYWEKCTTLNDLREQAILVMKADQLFEAALNLDPSNWDARYTKALSMSYWPADLKRGDEVIEQYRTLIQQQEAQASRPEFAKTYLRLGEQYEKAGHPDYAAQVWQRGAAFFPDNEDLAKKLAVR